MSGNKSNSKKRRLFCQYFGHLPPIIYLWLERSLSLVRGCISSLISLMRLYWWVQYQLCTHLWALYQLDTGEPSIPINWWAVSLYTGEPSINWILVSPESLYNGEPSINMDTGELSIFIYWWAQYPYILVSPESLYTGDWWALYKLDTVSPVSLYTGEPSIIAYWCTQNTII